MSSPGCIWRRDDAPRSAAPDARMMRQVQPKSAATRADKRNRPFVELTYWQIAHYQF
jgi:hypothetical protein